MIIETRNNVEVSETRIETPIVLHRSRLLSHQCSLNYHQTIYWICTTRIVLKMLMKKLKSLIKYIIYLTFLKFIWEFYGP